MLIQEHLGDLRSGTTGFASCFFNPHFLHAVAISINGGRGEPHILFLELTEGNLGYKCSEGKKVTLKMTVSETFEKNNLFALYAKPCAHLLLHPH